MIAGARKRISLMVIIASLAAMLIGSTAFAGVVISFGGTFGRYRSGPSIGIGIGPTYGYREYRSGPRVYVYTPYYWYNRDYYGYRYYQPYGYYGGHFRDYRDYNRVAPSPGYPPYSPVR